MEYNGDLDTQSYYDGDHYADECPECGTVTETEDGLAVCNKCNGE